MTVQFISALSIPNLVFYYPKNVRIKILRFYLPNIASKFIEPKYPVFLLTESGTAIYPSDPRKNSLENAAEFCRKGSIYIFSSFQFIEEVNFEKKKRKSIWLYQHSYTIGSGSTNNQTNQGALCWYPPSHLGFRKVIFSFF